jgi:hypothetical protein
MRRSGFSNLAGWDRYLFEVKKGKKEEARMIDYETLGKLLEPRR